MSAKKDIEKFIFKVRTYSYLVNPASAQCMQVQAICAQATELANISFFPLPWVLYKLTAVVADLSLDD